MPRKLLFLVGCLIVLSQKEMTQLADNQYETNIAHLPKGIYILKMKLDEKVGVRKIVVE